MYRLELGISEKNFMPFFTPKFWYGIFLIVMPALTIHCIHIHPHVPISTHMYQYPPTCTNIHPHCHPWHSVMVTPWLWRASPRWTQSAGSGCSHLCFGSSGAQRACESGQWDTFWDFVLSFKKNLCIPNEYYIQFITLENRLANHKIANHQINIISFFLSFFLLLTPWYWLATKPTL